ncbi:hypothetical protein SAMN05661010_02471 [Modicisalibacter muralis]|uniref:GGDEF domain-containing protein, diguanylate cyclase (C-di-GMP synthetase) or its enzymatically inactive variants n=1 Tax=Modicisalibacter muralis TaxID=119000 RepID=A0A1G9MQA4_9GAMM|nr:hypothetical protein [Halomonas muralis]SDL76283.1 hypothetical protein SAMN05661010_02471 [Halomonas muralis]
MESKFKDGLYRLTQLSTAAVMLILTLTPQDGVSRLLLAACAFGLAASALSRRRIAALSNAIVPPLLAVMLSLLLWVSPEQHAMWLWGWAAILALPQRLPLLIVHATLAALCWWWVQGAIGIEQSLLAGALLIALMLLGLAHGLGLQGLWQGMNHRAFPTPGMPLWTMAQLTHDLPLEIARCAREGSHGELLLLRSPSARQPTLASALATATRSFENRYRIDRHTLGVLLISRDVDEAHQRREALIEALPLPRQARFIALAPALSLPSQLSAMTRQKQAVVTLEEFS